MKKISSSLQNLILVLVGCALITGVLLAWVNHITEGPIAEKAEKTLADGIQEVMGTTGLTVTANDTLKLSMDGKEATFVVHQTADRNGRPLGAAVESTTLGFGGDLRVLVGFNPQGTILGYTILQTSETPGLGAKAQTWFQKGGKGDIIGMRPNEALLSVSKDGGQVDAITASTITSRAFLKAVNQAYAAYSQLVTHEHRTVNANK
ncbi:electron transport complex, RnfABCDGE type, G subunit [Prevotella dentalis DSM 3688]|uniref:Ion-translocating oxidoreductase complex subunit G n=1 Tax=Prevotella dentalis (strain ATCC 49559 / DSM 3688 / JCM 13448 / NCTC 12043 / ES 2772) TaxID=908937 RepID=F9CZP4_PREDD|nr:RnfABCDGE type electron transport complex subunit G [Prevotella dentalis]AGB28041.1 electron transport complex, RnfABCDGE type, G subunit [Prevotella dentalis DSM 3688]EGQ17727.1 electron transport complex protein RnfG [Prevotella dentalis DSM 3688]